MKTDLPEELIPSDETAMRERLMEKVLARSNGTKKEQYEVASAGMADTDKEK